MVSAAEAAQAAQGMAAAVGSTNLGPGQDQITDALSKMPRAALFDIMAQMKGLIQQNQQQARQILVTNPSLTRALFQAQILLGMLKNPLSADAVQQTGLPQAPPQPVPQPVPTPQQQFQPPHIPSQHQHAPAMRPQHVPSVNPNAPFPAQDMQAQPQLQQGGLPGAPQLMRHAPGQPMPGMLTPHCACGGLYPHISSVLSQLFLTQTIWQVLHRSHSMHLCNAPSSISLQSLWPGTLLHSLVGTLALCVPYVAESTLQAH